MMIPSQQLTICDDGSLVTEASDIGLRHWRDQITVIGDAGPKTFTFVAKDISGEDVAGYRYRSPDGQILLIIND